METNNMNANQAEQVGWCSLAWPFPSVQARGWALCRPLDMKPVIWGSVSLRYTEGKSALAESIVAHNARCTWSHNINFVRPIKMLGLRVWSYIRKKLTLIGYEIVVEEVSNVCVWVGVREPQTIFALNLADCSIRLCYNYAARESWLGPTFSSFGLLLFLPALIYKGYKTFREAHTNCYFHSDDDSSHSNWKRKLAFVKGAVRMKMWVNRLNEVRDNLVKHWLDVGAGEQCRKISSVEWIFSPSLI